MSEEQSGQPLQRKRFRDTSFIGAVVLPILGQAALLWEMLRWIDVLGLIGLVAVVIVVMRRAYLELDSHWIRQSGCFKVTEIRWDEAESLRVKRFPRLLVLLSGKKSVGVGRAQEDFDEVATEVLRRVGEQCEIDPRVLPTLKRWCDDKTRRIMQRAFFVVFLALTVGSAWGVWRTYIAGGAVIWIPVIGLLSSFVLGSYFISASDRRRRQLIMLYTTWAALSSGSLWLTVLGEFDRLMLVGLANVAAMLGSLGLTMTGISPTRRWNVSVGVSAFVLFGGSLIYLCEFSPYRAPVARIQGNYVLDYATWDSIDALLLVDWRHGRTVSLWVAPDATYELDRRIHLAPDERHVAFRVQRRGNSLEWHPSGWLVVCLRPPVRAPRRFPIPGFFSSFFDDMTHPALGSQGIWLDSRHLSLVRRKFKMGVADYIKELELCQLFTD